MRPFIVLGIYLLIPFLTSLFYKRLNVKGLILVAHIIVAILIFIYPYVMIKVDDYLNPPDPAEKSGCLMPVLGLFIGNTIFMIPVTQGLLFLFNLAFKNLYFPTIKTEL